MLALFTKNRRRSAVGQWRSADSQFSRLECSQNRLSICNKCSAKPALDNANGYLQIRAMRKHVTTDTPFENDIGYSRAVVCDGWVFVSGTTGYDYSTMIMPERIEDQCRNALQTIEISLKDAGACLDDVVRVRYIVPDPNEWSKCWPITAKAFEAARPAATMISAALQNSEMKIEIEATARISNIGINENRQTL